jgi:WD40 repeat protein
VIGNGTVFELHP